MDRAGRTAFRSGEAVELAPKEFDLLLDLLAHRNAVVSRNGLMKHVWGYADSLITRTIDTHIAELRRKLEDDPADPKHILTVRKVGYRLKA